MQKCDIISVDGGHDYEHAILDLFQFRRHADNATIGFIDDTGCTPYWCAGPSNALAFAVKTKLITVRATVRNAQGTRGVTRFSYN